MINQGSLMHLSEQTKPKAPQLPRILGLTSSVLMVVGIMIGTGIFKKIAPMSKLGLSEFSIIAAWIVAGIITMLGALSVSALTGLSDQSGGQYEYLRIIYGKFTAFIFGWSCFTIIGSASAAAMSLLFAQSLFALFPNADLGSPWVLKLNACLLILLLTLLNVRSTKKSAWLINLLTIGKIAGVLMLIIGGLMYNHTGQSSRPLVSDDSVFANLSVNNYIIAFFAAMLSAFWAYDGWLNVSFLSGEIKNPRRNIAWAIVGGTILVMVLYVFANISFLRVMDLQQFAVMGDTEIAARGVSDILFGKMGAVFLISLILISAVGSANGVVISYSRMYFKMAEDGVFFKSASRLHHRFKTPHVSIWISSVVSCLMVFWGNFDQLTDMIVFAGFIFYGMLSFGVVVMKRRGLIAAERMGYPFVPILFTLASAGLLFNTIVTQPLQTVAGIGLMCSGIPFYFYFKNKNKSC